MKERRFTLPCRDFRLEMPSSKSYLILQTTGVNSKEFFSWQMQKIKQKLILSCRKTVVSAVHFDNSIKTLYILLSAPKDKKKV